MFFEGIVSGIISGIIASLLVAFFMFKIKPKIKVSDKMCIKSDSGDKLSCQIKVINLSKVNLTNVVYTLLYCKEHGDDIRELYAIRPDSNDNMTIISKYNKNNTDYAVRFCYEIDKTKYPLDEKSKFVFRIHATHPYTNAITVKESVYTKENMVVGVYETGERLKIIKIDR